MFGINKNGTKHKIGIIMPAFFPASRITYDGTTSGLSATKVQGAIDAVEGQIANSSDAYSASKDYSVGDYCIYNDTLYRCVTACTAASWSVNSSCFVADTVVGAIGALGADLSASGLTFEYCTLVTGGYAEIGNLVVINLRITFDGSSSTRRIRGLPGYTSTAQRVVLNLVNASSNTLSFAAVNYNGVMTLVPTTSNADFIVSGSYIKG